MYVSMMSKDWIWLTSVSKIRLHSWCRQLSCSLMREVVPWWDYTQPTNDCKTGWAICFLFWELLDFGIWVYFLSLFVSVSQFKSGLEMILRHMASSSPTMSPFWAMWVDSWGADEKGGRRHVAGPRSRTNSCFLQGGAGGGSQTHLAGVAVVKKGSPWKHELRCQPIRHQFFLFLFGACRLGRVTFQFWDVLCFCWCQSSCSWTQITYSIFSVVFCSLPACTCLLVGIRPPMHPPARTHSPTHPAPALATSPCPPAGRTGCSLWKLWNIIKVCLKWIHMAPCLLITAWLD